MNIEQLAVLVTLLTDEKPTSAPSYMEEKLKVVQKMEKPELLLDSGKKAVYMEWHDKWSDYIDMYMNRL